MKKKAKKKPVAAKTARKPATAAKKVALKKPVKLLKSKEKISPKLAKPTMKPILKPAGKKGATPQKPTKISEAKKAEIISQLTETTPEAEVILTNADGKMYCKMHDCDNEATTEGLCRLHYIATWKRNKIKAKILQGGKLDKYIEDLTQKYPDKYLEMLRKDLASEKDFNLIVAEMDLEDDGDENENEEETSRFIEEVRGGVPSSDDEDSGF